MISKVHIRIKNLVRSAALIALFLLSGNAWEKCLCQVTKNEMTRQVDLKVFYFRNLRQEINDGFNVIQLVPKLSFIQSRLNVYIPVGIFQELVYQQPFSKESEVSFFLSPRISAEILRKGQFDLCIGAYSEMMMMEGQRASPCMGLTTGLGYYCPSKNLYVRLEVGFDLPYRQCNRFRCNTGFTIGYRIESRQGRARTAAYNPNRFLASLSKVVETRK